MASYKVMFVVALLCLPLVHSFLLNSNSSQSGFGNDNQDHMSRRIDSLQAQIQLQNKTLESQSALIQQLLNHSKQSPSTETLSNELAVLRTFVQRIMDEYQRLSSIANTTDLALKINSMANSIQILTTSVTGQQHVEVDLMRKLDFLNATVLGLKPSLNRITSIEQYLLLVNHSLTSLGPENQHKLVTLTNDFQGVRTKLVAMQGTLINVQHQVAALEYQNSVMSTKLNSLTQDVSVAKTNVQSLETVVFQNQQFASSHISTLSSRYSLLSTLLHETQTRVTTLEHNLESEVITRIMRHGKVPQAFGRGSGDIVLDDVVCNGDESSIALCRHHGFGLNNCGHGEDVGVICFDIRLVGGSSQREGRVEVKVGSTWGTVCDDSWDESDARVVCRTLGYSTGSVRAFSSAHFGEGTGPVLMDDVNCSGSEKSLALCPFRGFGNENCGHSEDAGVACQ